MMNSLDSSVDAYKKEFQYDFDNEIILNYYPDRIISKINSGSFLELGLGHGYTVRKFLQHVEKYTILEGSKAVIKNFKTNEPELCKKVRIIDTYFENFETDESYDFIIMGFILEHVDNPDLILHRYKKLLSKNGRIFIAVPNAESLHRQIGFHAGLIDNLKSLSCADRLLGHKRYYDLHDLKKMVLDHGLKIRSVEGIFLKPFMTSQLESLNLHEDIIMGMLQVGQQYPELSNAILMELEIE